MDVASHIIVLAEEGVRLADAARAGGLDASVPTCPGWQVRDLVRHMGEVHRWATGFVRDAATRPVGSSIDDWPDDQELLNWFEDGHAALVDALTAAPPDLVCWSFLPSETPLHFWARRQSHETSIHRADADAANGRTSEYDAQSAVDGIDELLTGFLPRPGTPVHLAEGRTLLVAPTDADARWLVTVGPEMPEARALLPAELARPDADATMAGPASDLYLALWNRKNPSGIALEGDALVLEVWRSSMRVQWQ